MENKNQAAPAAQQAAPNNPLGYISTDARAMLEAGRCISIAVTTQPDFRRIPIYAVPATAGMVEDAKDAARLDFIAEREAWIAWTKDGESCRVFVRNEDGDTQPMMGWIPEAWAHDSRTAIDAAMAAQQAQARTITQAGFIKPSSEEAACTCPSGDGSLRWPYPAHPPGNEQAQASAKDEGGAA